MSRVEQKYKNLLGEFNLNQSIFLSSKNPDSYVVGISSSIIVPSNVNRAGLILINVSSNRISLGFGVNAVLDKGATLYPGGVFNMAEFDFFNGDIYAVASDVNSIITIQEFVMPSSVVRIPVEQLFG